MIEIFVDGACSGNPGPAGIGVVIKRNGDVIKEISRAIGPATNNIAEYMALLYALKEVLLWNTEKIQIFTDSELVYRQVIGEYKVKDEKLQPLHAQVKRVLENFSDINIAHVTRDKNTLADRLATSAIV